MRTSAEVQDERRELQQRLAQLTDELAAARTVEAGLTPGELIQETKGKRRKGAVVSAWAGSVKVRLVRANGTVGAAEVYFWHWAKIEAGEPI